MRDFIVDAMIRILIKYCDPFSKFSKVRRYLEKAILFDLYFLLQVLSGCGVYDGTEIHEAAAIMVHLSRGGANVDMYAPNISQMHVVDHSRGQPADRESRNVLTESARIARGKIIDLARLAARDYDAVVFPGGFGAAKNLSTFSVDGKDCKVNKDVERVLKDFHKSGKPIGHCLIFFLAPKNTLGLIFRVGLIYLWCQIVGVSV
uniref:Glutamine amidotransferase class 1 domain containing 3 n=1 Tax=Naja naja TaxID=35670 RepID=A0A8C7E0F8_NAJNA